MREWYSEYMYKPTGCVLHNSHIIFGSLCLCLLQTPTAVDWIAPYIQPTCGLVIALLTLELVLSGTSTQFSDGSFLAAGPQVWNGLLSALRAPDLTFDCFKRWILGAI